MTDPNVKTEKAPFQEQEDETMEIAENMTQLYFKGVPRETTEEDLISHFQAWGATLQLYKSHKMGFDSPYGFLLCENDKVKTLLQNIHRVKGATLEVNYARRKVYTMKYFLDSRTTKGAIGEIKQDKIRDYFSQYGEVTRVNIEAGKGIGFVDLNVPEKCKSLHGLAWKTHTIDGHVIDVQESSSKRKRKRRGRKSFNKRIKPSYAKGQAKQTETRTETQTETASPSNDMRD